MTDPGHGHGHRGYISSRPILGTRVPQHIQNLVVREHARRHGLHYLLSAVEYIMPDCFMMLEQTLDELPQVDGIIFYSLFMLPTHPQRRRAILARILDSGREFHAAVEDLVVRTRAEAEALDDILTLEAIAAEGATVNHLRQGGPGSS